MTTKQPEQWTRSHHMLESTYNQAGELGVSVDLTIASLRASGLDRYADRLQKLRQVVVFIDAQLGAMVRRVGEDLADELVNSETH